MRAHFGLRSIPYLVGRSAALQWIHNLARAFRVSFVADGVAGAGLSMAYFEMFYVLVILVAIQENIVKQRVRSAAPADRSLPQSTGGEVVMAEGRAPMGSMKRPL